LGEDFQRLHPKIQERFGFDSKSRKRAIGRGIMDRVWRGKFFTTPFLMVGTWRNIMFPEKAKTSHLQSKTGLTSTLSAAKL
ncbi:MAG TPA: DUF4166 domain-containing protein, partial [Bryobacteraceae bacterium]|nr:DUF4166 domain-containing protein [Bryobacteraceae bacterium]